VSLREGLLGKRCSPIRIKYLISGKKHKSRNYRHSAFPPEIFAPKF
jgi:hypothetical protein